MNINATQSAGLNERRKPTTVGISRYKCLICLINASRGLTVCDSMATRETDANPQYVGFQVRGYLLRNSLRDVETGGPTLLS
jgi:hypothetical protein